MIQARNLQRNVAAVKWFTTTATSSEVATAATTTATLLTAENLVRCVGCMQKAGPPPTLKLRQKKSESAFASVLIALCVSEGEAAILYTRRSSQLSRHFRQISFPGGMQDPTDVDQIDCALRETEEEIGLPRSRIEICGVGSLIKLPSAAAITPVIGVVRDFDLAELRLNEREVEEAFTLPVIKLAEPSSLHHTQYRSGYSAPAFIVGNYRVWGITGFLTYVFMNCLLPRELNKLKNRVKFITPHKSI